MTEVGDSVRFTMIVEIKVGGPTFDPVSRADQLA